MDEHSSSRLHFGREFRTGVWEAFTAVGLLCADPSGNVSGLPRAGCLGLFTHTNAMVFNRMTINPVHGRKTAGART